MMYVPRSWDRLLNQLGVDLWFKAKLAPGVCEWKVEKAKGEKEACKDQHKHRNLIVFVNAQPKISF